MVALFVTSTERSAGKTAIAAALGKHLQENRKKVGYIRLSAPGAVGDTAVMKQALGLKESDVPADATYEKVAQGKDIVIIEGEGSIPVPDARVILVVGYSPTLSSSSVAAAMSGKNLLGVVVNRVPKSRIESVKRELASVGVKLLGVVPEDRTLAALTVGELAQRIGGEVTGNTGDLVESYMVGALGLDSGITYFSRKTNKAVVSRVDRPDLQMAALETPTKCLIITNDKAPAPVVLNRAKQKKVPVVMVKEDIKSTLSRIEDALESVPFSPKKLARMTEVLSGFDFATVDQAAGIAAK